MAKKYLIWKNANPNEWLQITGQEFYALVNSKEAQGRYFIHLANGSCPNDEPDDIYIEVALKQYQEYRLEQNHTDYLIRLTKNICVLSLDQPILNSTGEEKSLHEILHNNAECVSEKAVDNILKAKLREAVKSLSEKEQKIVDAIYWRQLSQGEAAAELGITQQRVSMLQKRIIKKLKLGVVEFEKSQQ